MKVRLNAVLNAPEDYSCGDCKKCPIHQESYFSTNQYEEVKINCPLGYTSVSCSLEPQVESETPQPFINKPCISDEVCREDKIQMLNKIIAEIEQIEINGHIKDVECFRAGVNTVRNIIVKYKIESEN